MHIPIDSVWIREAIKWFFFFLKTILLQFSGPNTNENIIAYCIQKECVYIYMYVYIYNTLYIYSYHHRIYDSLIYTLRNKRLGRVQLYYKLHR